MELLPLAGVLTEAPGTMSYYFVHIEKQCGEHLFFGCRLEQSGLDVEIILAAGIQGFFVWWLLMCGICLAGVTEYSCEKIVVKRVTS